MTETRLTKSVRVLRRPGAAPPNPEHGAAFWVADEDTGLMTTVLSITADDWEALGRPTELTVAIEPGDHLNTD